MNVLDAALQIVEKVGTQKRKELACVAPYVCMETSFISNLKRRRQFHHAATTVLQKWMKNSIIGGGISEAMAHGIPNILLPLNTRIKQEKAIGGA